MRCRLVAQTNWFGRDNSRYHPHPIYRGVGRASIQYFVRKEEVRTACGSGRVLTNAECGLSIAD